MADSPPVTRKRSRNIEAAERAVTRDRRHTGDWKDGGRANRQEEDKTDKGRKKLVAPLPPNLCGITGVPKADAKADSREIESCTEMQPTDPEREHILGVQATPAPAMTEENQILSKRSRLLLWISEPSKIATELHVHKRAVARAHEDDQKIEHEREQWEQWFSIMRAHLIAGHRPLTSWSPEAEEEEEEEDVDLASNSPASSGAAPSSSQMSRRNANESPTPTVSNGSAETSPGHNAGANHDGGSSPAEKDVGNMTPKAHDSAEGSSINGGAGAGAGATIEEAGGRNMGVGSAATCTSGANPAAGGCASGGVVAASEKKSSGGGVMVKRRGGHTFGGGRKYQEKRWVQYLESTAMRRACIQGNFDMNKVVGILSNKSDNIVKAQQERCLLLSEDVSGASSGASPGEAYLTGKMTSVPSNMANTSGVDGCDAGDRSASTLAVSDSGECAGRTVSNIENGVASGTGSASKAQDAAGGAAGEMIARACGVGSAKTVDDHEPAEKVKRPEAHPGDKDVLNRWGVMVRSVDGNLSDWRRSVVDGDEGRRCEPEGGGVARPAPLIPRGHDLLPTMRVSVLPHIGVPKPPVPGFFNGDSSSKVGEAGHDGKASPETENDGAFVAKKIAEYVPWVGGSQVDMLGKEEETQSSSSKGAGNTVEGIRERLQWFPRSLPLYVARLGFDQDDIDCAAFRERKRVARARIRDMKADLEKRQVEMEIRRREKVEDALRLVNAAAEHDQKRKAYQQRVSSLRRQLVKLDCHRSNSQATGFPNNETVEKEGKQAGAGERTVFAPVPAPTPTPTMSSRSRSPLPPPSSNLSAANASSPSIPSLASSHSRSTTSNPGETHPNGVGAPGGRGSNADEVESTEKSGSSGMSGEKSGDKTGGKDAEGSSASSASSAALAVLPPIMTRERASPRTAASPAAYTSFTNSIVANSGDGKKGSNADVDDKANADDREAPPRAAGSKRSSAGTGVAMATRTVQKRRKSAESATPMTVTLRSEDVSPGDSANGAEAAAGGSASEATQSVTTKDPSGSSASGSAKARAKAVPKRTTPSRTRAKSSRR